jgi:hypothetical protein
VEGWYMEKLEVVGWIDGSVSIEQRPAAEMKSKL